MGGYEEMMMSDVKVGGWVKKVQNHDDVILEWSLTHLFDQRQSLTLFFNPAQIYKFIRQKLF